MTLISATRLGPYEIVAPLGAGGMGEVYRAKDPRLGREVALKVLPADVASHPDRLARFEREARTVAGLSHPNIVVLHSIEDAGGIRFLTMELVDGQGLDRHPAVHPRPPQRRGGPGGIGVARTAAADAQRRVLRHGRDPRWAVLRRARLLRPHHAVGTAAVIRRAAQRALEGVTKRDNWSRFAFLRVPLRSL